MEPLAHGRVRCPFCDRQFWPGFPFNQHKTKCALRPERAAGALGGDDSTGDCDNNAHNDNDGEDAAHQPDTPPIHQSRQPPQARAFEQQAIRRASGTCRCF